MLNKVGRGILLVEEFHLFGSIYANGDRELGYLDKRKEFWELGFGVF